MIAGMLETTSATVWHDFSLIREFVPDLFLSNLKLLIMMTLEEAIEHCAEVTKKCSGECAAEHEQLRKWLKELKTIRERAIRSVSMHYTDKSGVEWVRFRGKWIRKGGAAWLAVSRPDLV